MSSRLTSPASRARLALGALIAGVLSAAAPAGAQGTSPRDTAAARAFFLEGVACADRQDWECAADRFERAYALRPSPVIAYNLGTARISLGHLVEGAELLGQVTRDDAASPQVRADARRAADEVAPRIGRLTVRVDGPTDGVSFAIGEHDLPVSMLGVPAPVDPGEHDIIARRDGEVIASGHVTIEASGSAEVALRIEPRPEPEPAIEPPIETTAGVPPDRSGDEDRARAAIDLSVPPEPSSDPTPWIALGISGAVLVVGGAIVLGVVLGSSQEASPFDGNIGRVEIGR